MAKIAAIGSKLISVWDPVQKIFKLGEYPGCCCQTPPPTTTTTETTTFATTETTVEMMIQFMQNGGVPGWIPVGDGTCVFMENPPEGSAVYLNEYDCKCGSYGEC